MLVSLIAKLLASSAEQSVGVCNEVLSNESWRGCWWSSVAKAARVLCIVGH